MIRIALAVRALYRGAQLAQVETWKRVSVATTALTGFLSALAGLAFAFGWIPQVPAELIVEASSGLVAIIMAVIGYLQVATTEKIGLEPKRPSAPSPAADRVDRSNAGGLQPMPDSPGDQRPDPGHRGGVDDALGPWGGAD